MCDKDRKGKIIWKGILKNIGDVPKRDVSENAVKIKNANLLTGLICGALFFIVLGIILRSLFISMKCYLYGMDEAEVHCWVWAGLVLALATLPLHEYLHIIALPRHFEKYVWLAPKAGAVMCTYTEPISKKRWIFMALLPNIVVAFISLLIWTIIPIQNNTVSDIFINFINYSLICGSGDFASIFQVATRIPNKMMIQDVGADVYWFNPLETDSRTVS